MTFNQYKVNRYAEKKVKIPFHRVMELEENPELPLTQEEIADGWHRCPDWDFMLVHPKMPESDACLCGIAIKGNT